MDKIPSVAPLQWRDARWFLPALRAMRLPIHIDRAPIASFCQKWRITEFALFGSVLPSDFGPHSDIDVLVTFEESAPWSLWDIVAMQDELSELFHRSVDLVEKKAIKNPYRRQRILSNYKVIHAA